MVQPTLGKNMHQGVLLDTDYSWEVTERSDIAHEANLDIKNFVVSSFIFGRFNFQSTASTYINQYDDIGSVYTLQFHETITSSFGNDYGSWLDGAMTLTLDEEKLDFVPLFADNPSWFIIDHLLFDFFIKFDDENGVLPFHEDIQHMDPQVCHDEPTADNCSDYFDAFPAYAIVSAVLSIIEESTYEEFLNLLGFYKIIHNDFDDTGSFSYHEIWRECRLESCTESEFVTLGDTLVKYNEDGMLLSFDHQLYWEDSSDISHTQVFNLISTDLIQTTEASINVNTAIIPISVVALVIVRQKKK